MVDPVAFQAITTKYIGATDHNPSRIRAAYAGGGISVSWDHSLDTVRNHVAAAKALAEKLEWKGEYHIGGMQRGSTHRFVFVATLAAATLAFGGAE